MTEQPNGPDEVADEQARRQKDEREALADGGGHRPSTEVGLEDEAAYSTEAEQGAAQPTPGQ